MAQSGHHDYPDRCPLLGVKRTLRRRTMKSTIAQKEASPNKTIVCPHTILVQYAGFGQLIGTIAARLRRQTAAGTTLDAGSWRDTRCGGQIISDQSYLDRPTRFYQHSNIVSLGDPRPNYYACLRTSGRWIMKYFRKNPFSFGGSS
jgi:hypothetical protein